MTEGTDAARPAAGGGPVRGPGVDLPHAGILGVADRFRDDDGSADPAASAALAAFAAGAGSEHAALLALAAARLLVPVVAQLGAEGQEAGGGEKSSDMALPALVGRDGRRAVPAFTSLAALARWQPSARPMPAGAGLVWRAAAADACSVVIDVAGPVPLVVEGARLAALAQGEPVPAPHEDPDVQAAVGAAITGAVARTPAAAALAARSEPAGALAGFVLHPGVDGGDLLIELTAAPMVDVQQLAAEVGPAVLELLGTRLRRGIALALSPPPA